MGTRKNGRARRRHACLPRARQFSLSPTTSKRLQRRLKGEGGETPPKSARVILKEIQSCKVWVVLFSGPNHAYTATAQKMLDVCNKALSEVSHCVLGCCDVIIIVVQLL